MIQINDPFSVALQHQRAGRLQEAAAAYEKLLSSTPDHEQGHLHLGATLFRLGRHTEAATRFQRVLELNPENPTARENLALLTTAPFAVARPPELVYVGDLSRQDAHVLAKRARKAHRILEFGVGASTQIFAQASPPQCEVFSLETDPAWTSKVEGLLEVTGQRHKVRILPYEGWQEAECLKGGFDLILDDGLESLRLEFGLAAWRHLKVGGCLMFHDTRRAQDFGNVLRVMERHQAEIDQVRCNTRASNLTLLTKKLSEPYQNWNVLERKQPWQFGFAGLEETLDQLRPER